MQRLVHCDSGLIIEVDPLDAFPVPANRVMDACGYVPEWVCNPLYLNRPLQEALTLQYGFGDLREMKGGQLTQEGVYLYPGDPAQFPLIRIRRGSETFYMFRYAFVAIVQANGDYFMTVMD